VDWILNHPAEFEQMRQEARAQYEAKYTAERNYEMLTEIYKKAGNIRKDGIRGNLDEYS
jgi:glycosyltransferase involved in cell wall biosynthesis